MNYGIVGTLVPVLFKKPIYEYTSKVLPELDMAAFKKLHKKEYKAMVGRTPGVGGMKDNMFAIVMYLACYGFSYYRALGDKATLVIFDGMIDALCTCDTMKRLYKNKNCFDQKEIDKYVRGSERSKKTRVCYGLGV